MDRKIIIRIGDRNVEFSYRVEIMGEDWKINARIIDDELRRILPLESISFECVDNTIPIIHLEYGGPNFANELMIAIVDKENLSLTGPCGC